MARKIVITFLLLLIALPARASESAGSFTVPFLLMDGYVIVDVRLNGAGPFHFMFDTGADLALLESTARKLAVTTDDGGDVTGDGGNKVRFRRATLQQVELGAWRTSAVRTAVMPEDDVKATFGIFPMSGFIGAPLLENMTVKLDYIHRTLTLTPAGRYSYSGAGTILSVRDGLVMASVDGLVLPFFVDTGTSPGMILGTLARDGFDLVNKRQPSIAAISDWGLGGAVRAQLTRAHIFRIGDIKLADPVLLLSVQKTGTLVSDIGRLGYGVLSRFDVTFDARRSRIILEKNSDFGRPEVHDRSGMWIGPKGNSWAALDVVPGGPADRAGVKPGDTILSIDGIPTGNLVLPIEREKFEHDPAGTVVRLSLRSGSRVRGVSITLRDLI